MKVRVDASELADAVKWLGGATQATRHTMPALSGMLMHADDGKLTLSATDLDSFAQVTLTANVDEPGTALAPHRAHGVIGRLPSSKAATLAASGSDLEIHAGSIKARVSCLDYHDFPAMPSLDDAATVGLDADVIDHVARHLCPAVYRLHDKPVLGGVNITCNGGTMFAATDRVRVATFHVAGQADAAKATVPPNLFTTGAKMGAATLAIGDGFAALRSDDRWVASRLLEGGYPDVAPFFDAGPISIIVDAEALAKALDRSVAFLGTKENVGVTLDVADDVMTVDTTDAAENVSEQVDVVANDAIRVRLNPALLSAALKGVEGGTAELCLHSPKRPLVVRAAEGGRFTCAMAPMQPRSGE